MSTLANTLNSVTQRTKRIGKALLFCGVLSSLVYVGTDIIASIMWESYSYTAQAFSELLAYGAPTRSFVLSLTMVYNALVIAFGLHLWKNENKKTSINITGIVLVVYAVVGIITPLFFPAPLRGSEETFRNFMHLPLTGLEVLCILLSIGFGAVTQGKWFRIYSIATMLIMLVFGYWAGSAVPDISTHQLTPFLGIIERVMIYGYMLWVEILAIIHLRKEYPSGTVKILS